MHFLGLETNMNLEKGRFRKCALLIIFRIFRIRLKNKRKIAENRRTIAIDHRHAHERASNHQDQMGMNSLKTNRTNFLS